MEALVLNIIYRERFVIMKLSVVSSRGFQNNQYCGHVFSTILFAGYVKFVMKLFILVLNIKKILYILKNVIRNLVSQSILCTFRNESNLFKALMFKV